METFYEILGEYQEIYELFDSEEDFTRIDLSIWATISQMGLMGKIKRVKSVF